MKVGALKKNVTDQGTRTELDSHANTCAMGKIILVIQDFNYPVNVSGYGETKGSVHKASHAVSAVVAYDCPQSGETIMLIIHQAIQILSMHHNLLCPMQLCLNDKKISECPKFLTDHNELSDTSHAVVVTSEDDIFNIPLDLHGIKSYFPTRVPSLEEIHGAQHTFELTAEEPQWDPTAHPTQNKTLP